MVLEGGCFCGFVRYRIDGAPSQETGCHCSICRRTTGAPFVAWFTVAPAEFAFVSGHPTRFASSDHATRTFCPRCGTQLTFQSSHAADEIDVTTCSLDDPERVPPRDHTRTSARLSWVTLGDGLRQFVESRS
jgi:hypothetical protein